MLDVPVWEMKHFLFANRDAKQSLRCSVAAGVASASEHDFPYR
jgi:hypothetical protein